MRTQLANHRLTGQFQPVAARTAKFVGDSSCGDAPKLHALGLFFCNSVVPQTLAAEEFFLAIVMFETERLRFRTFQPNDLEKYTAHIFGDPAVMQYLPARSDALSIERAAHDRVFQYHCARRA